MRYNSDSVARSLIGWGRLAKSMPPSWDGALINQPMVSVENGSHFGQMLPGTGFYLDADLKDLGITKPLPYVFERGRTLRLIDQFEKLQPREGRITIPKRGYDFPELTKIAAAIQTYAQIQSQRAAGLFDDCFVTWPTAVGGASTDRWLSSFQVTSNIGAGSFTANPGATMNKTNSGAISSLLRNPTGTNTKYLISVGYGLGVNAVQVNTAALVDLLVGAGNISPTVITPITIGTPALTRYTNGAGVLLTFEVTTTLSATVSSLSFSYTNQAGTAGQTSPSQTFGSATAGLTVSCLLPGLTTTGPSLFFMLAQGDYGVRTVASVTFGTALTSGVVALSLFYPLVFLTGYTGSGYFEKDSTADIHGLTTLATEAGGALGCLTMYWVPNGSGINPYFCHLKTVEG